MIIIKEEYIYYILFTSLKKYHILLKLTKTNKVLLFEPGQY